MLGPCWVWGYSRDQGRRGAVPQTLTLPEGRQTLREFRCAHGDKGEVRDLWGLVTEVVRSSPEEVRSSPNTLHLKPKHKLFAGPFKALEDQPLSISPASAHPPLAALATLLYSHTLGSVLPLSLCTHWTLCLESSLPGWLAICKAVPSSLSAGVPSLKMATLTMSSDTAFPQRSSMLPRCGVFCFLPFIWIILLGLFYLVYYVSPQWGSVQKTQKGPH